jgi:hypothetical protein
MRHSGHQSSSLPAHRGAYYTAQAADSKTPQCGIVGCGLNR